jgi:endo-1,4-beta-xylanase
VLDRRQVLAGLSAPLAGAAAPPESPAHVQQNACRGLVSEKTLDQSSRPLSDGKPDAASPESGLGAAAARCGVLYGAAFGAELWGRHFAADSGDFEAYGALARREVRLITSETPFHFAWMRPQADVVDYAPSDQLAAFAAGAGLPLRASCLVWTDALPEWLKRASPREARAVFDRHITETVARYGDSLHSIDACNEPTFPDQWRGPLRPGPWFEAWGRGYIGRAFRLAHAAAPRCRLTLNEAFCEQADEVGASVRRNFLALLDDLLMAGVPVGAVGFQGHLKPDLPHDDARFADYLHDVGTRGLPIFITELDVDDRRIPGDAAARDAVAAARYRDFLGAVLKVPAVTTIINWSLSDRYSWLAREPAERPGRLKGDPRPLPFDAAYRAKPARAAMMAAFAGAPKR